MTYNLLRRGAVPRLRIRRQPLRRVGSHFRFTDPGNTEYVERFEVGFEVLERLPCDVVIAPQQRIENLPEGLADREGCRRYAEAMRSGLELAVEREGYR